MADVPMTLTDCWCGLPFSMPTRLYRQCKDNGETFYCPLGHTIVFSETNADKYRREAERLKQQVARAEDETAQERNLRILAEKREKRLQKRVSAGTCPCCKRTFSNMATHMKKQHPEFIAEQGGKVVPLKSA